MKKSEAAKKSMQREYGHTRASIMVSLPTKGCEQVRDVVEVLTVLEEVYNHLYTWCLLVEEATRSFDFRAQSDLHPKLGLFSSGGLAVPAVERLCLAQIETNPPPFVEVAGNPRVIRIMQDYLARHDAGAFFSPTEPLHSDGVEPVRCEIELLCGLNFSPDQIQEVLSKHIFRPLTRLERVRGIGIDHSYGTVEAAAVAGV